MSNVAWWMLALLALSKAVPAQELWPVPDWTVAPVANRSAWQAVERYAFALAMISSARAYAPTRCW